MSKTAEKRTYRTCYRTSWERNPMLKDWIQAVPEKPDKAYCRFCERVLYAHRYSVLKHTCTTKHQQNADKFNGKIPQSTQRPIAALSDQFENCADDPPPPLVRDEDNDVKLITNEEVEEELKNDEFLRTEANDTDGEFLTFTTPGADIEEDEDPEDSVAYDEEYYEPEEEDRDEVASPRQSPSNMPTNSPTISTHILDTSRGKAAANVPVMLFKLEDNNWKELSRNTTNTDGRISDLTNSNAITTGSYKLHFDTFDYFKQTVPKFLYPFVEIVFNVDEAEHYHIPLLLNPFGYSTYRGT